jgi:hypothetical protein
MWLPNSAKPRVELEALLQRLFVFGVGRILDDNSIIVFADLSALLRLGSAFPCVCFSKCGREGGVEMYFFRSSYKIKKIYV